MPRRSKSEELLEFEISFYEKLLTAYPDFIDVLIPLANAYTRRGLHEKGLEVDRRLTELRQDDPLAWYNLACSYSLLTRIDEHGLKRETFDWYLDLRKYGSVPHAGFGLGIERTVAWICGIDHLREASPFPRMIHRLRP